MATRSHSDRCRTCGRSQKRSTDANRRYWSLLTKMADTLKPGGESYTPLAYHAYYKARFLGCDDIKLPSGKVLTIPRSTADLDSTQFADYMTQVEADANERGVFLDD